MKTRKQIIQETSGIEPLMLRELTQWRELYKAADSEAERGNVLAEHRESLIEEYEHEFGNEYVKDQVLHAVELQQEGIRGETELDMAAGCSAMVLLLRREEDAGEE